MSYRDLQKKVASLSMRERILVCLVGVALFVFPGYLSFVDRYKTDTRRTQDSMGARGAELAEVQEELAKWQGMLTQNPNDVLRSEKEEYQKVLAELDESLDRETMNLISASQMAGILTGVLSGNSSVKITKTESVPPRLLFHKDDVKLYQHGVIITLNGRYMDIMRYLEGLEAMKTSFFWKSFDYRVTKYPEAEAVLEIYTLSINRDFIRG
ncbi:hypothetical protein [Succinimonas amylolytica]|uniref:hypothetical protein n=1 Tax=Succinimonas amylolytica TaxID=83769 RepID=UPI0023A8C27E